MQYYDATGTLLGSDTYEPSAMQVERADDGSMLVTFEMPQMPQEGYYSMSVMDLTTSDEGYGEFMISEGSLVPHAIPIGDDSDEVMVDKKENAHQVPTIDELKTMESSVKRSRRTSRMQIRRVARIRLRLRCLPSLLKTRTSKPTRRSWSRSPAD